MGKKTWQLWVGYQLKDKEDQEPGMVVIRRKIEKDEIEQPKQDSRAYNAPCSILSIAKEIEK